MHVTLCSPRRWSIWTGVAYFGGVLASKRRFSQIGRGNSILRRPPYCCRKLRAKLTGVENRVAGPNIGWLLPATWLSTYIYELLTLSNIKLHLWEKQVLGSSDYKVRTKIIDHFEALERSPEKVCVILGYIL